MRPARKAAILLRTSLRKLSKAPLYDISDHNSDVPVCLFLNEGVVWRYPQKIRATLLVCLETETRREDWRAILSAAGRASRSEGSKRSDCMS